MPNSRAQKNAKREHDPNNAANYGGVAPMPMQDHKPDQASPLGGVSTGGSSVTGGGGGVSANNPAVARQARSIMKDMSDRNMAQTKSAFGSIGHMKPKIVNKKIGRPAGY